MVCSAVRMEDQIQNFVFNDVVHHVKTLSLPPNSYISNISSRTYSFRRLLHTTGNDYRFKGYDNHVIGLVWGKAAEANM